ncbi:hypothetical protein J1907_14975 [Lysinibacillus sphaericus]|uniref:Imm3 family immunity protein n=1 Tax=Lysinibacillus sphaericus TaxID=1421 RepID=UPI0018CCC857|nr:Imm3 family immunity protein [Lysinibacillus sphaericus]QPA57442.1 hypothetical protein INQ55_14695 [Lysinibacillus sphaericus]QTB21085.1 hypothetical protein J1907_14975 [Lysinibacillus sphaericus]
MVYSYEEYEEYILEDYNDLIEEKMSKGEAIARTLNEYDMLAKRSETDKAMFCIIILEIIITHEKVSYSYMNYIEQLNRLIYRKAFVLQELKKRPLTYYQRVCWYYNELNEEVRKFIDNYIKKIKM